LMTVLSDLLVFVSSASLLPFPVVLSRVNTSCVV
jgi:hypothetical protein